MAPSLLPLAGHAPDETPRRSSSAIALHVLAACAAIYTLQFAASLLIPLVLSVFLFHALEPVVAALQRWKIPRLIGAIVVVAGLATGLGAAGRTLWPQVDAVIMKIPEGAARLRTVFGRKNPRAERTPLDKVQQAANAIDSAAAEVTQPPPRTPGVVQVEVRQPWRASDWLWTSSASAVGLAGQAVTIFVLTILLLGERTRLERAIERRFTVPVIGTDVTSGILADISSQIRRFIWVQALTSGGVALCTALALWWIGFEQPVAWGLLAGVMNIVPYYGPLVVSALLTVAGFLQFGTVWGAALAGGIAFAITSLEGMVLTPYLLTRTVSLNAVAIFVSLAFWSWIWGVAGMFLAVPILAAIKAVCDHVDGLHRVGDLIGQQ